MQLSIIIVSYNTKEITRNCLQSIRNSKLQLEYEIILVDNASSDGSVQMVQAEFPEVRLIANETNNMFAKANNQAMQVAKGDYFLLLNSDTIVEPGNVEKLYEFIDTNQPKVGCVGPRVLNKDGTLQSEGFALPSWQSAACTVMAPLTRRLPDPLQRIIVPVGHKLSPVRKGNRTVGWVVGACFMFSRTNANLTGGLDEKLGFYGEEVDFCFQLKKRGLSTWLVDEATIVHLGGGSRDNKSEWAQEMLIKSKGYCLQKNLGTWGARLCVFIYVLGFGIASLVSVSKHERNRFRHGRLFYGKVSRELNA